MKFGDFSGLANAYSEARPKYAPQILDLLIKTGSLNSQSKIVDVGAGTGIWTRMLAEKIGADITAVEPNADMFNSGLKDSEKLNIKWLNQSAEDYTYMDSTADLITMASSFHWVDYEIAISNFKKTLKKGGIFCALWNTRAFELTPKLLEIENYLKSKLTMDRVSSGRSKFTDELLLKLENSFGEENVFYAEGHHTENMTLARYLRIWESVNDVQVQLGEKKFKDFIYFIKSTLSENETIEAHYLTKSWIAIKR